MHLVLVHARTDAPMDEVPRNNHAWKVGGTRGRQALRLKQQSINHQTFTLPLNPEICMRSRNSIKSSAGLGIHPLQILWNQFCGRLSIENMAAKNVYRFFLTTVMSRQSKSIILQTLTLSLNPEFCMTSRISIKSSAGLGIHPLQILCSLLCR